MPKLRCSASSCAHNQEECCCRGKINVAGEAASTSNETCCDNFFEDAGNARDAVSQEPMENIDIDCEAQNCVHNQSCKCHADYVDVNGYGANSAGETACSSFCPQS
nr:DUF1540 domain-containing protein [uncultured Cellulosilyticum sp.]